MPRYFFHIHDSGIFLEDEDGLVCLDENAAKRQAITIVNDLYLEASKLGRDPATFCVEICEERGKVLASLSATEARQSNPRFGDHCGRLSNRSTVH